MNFVKHLKDIENKLFRKDRYGGVMFIHATRQILRIS